MTKTKDRFGLLIAFGLLSACASARSIPFSVVSNPPGAPVDVNGVSMGTTPLQISLSCSRRWVGVMNAPDGWAYDTQPYEITVYPSTQNPGFSQTKRVNPCLVQESGQGTIQFDLGLDSVKPKERIEIN